MMRTILMMNRLCIDPSFTTFEWNEIMKIGVPSVVAIIVLIRQLKRNREMQAEGTFFSLLNSIRNLVANTEGEIKPLKDATYSDSRNFETAGVRYFAFAVKELNKRLGTKLGDALVNEALSIQNIATNSPQTQQKAIDIYNIFFADHLVELGHYFRFTYNVLNFVDSSPVPKKKKIEYVNFIQSQMSDSELQLIFFNGLGSHGKKYHFLIEKYNFLQYMSSEGNKGFIELLENLYPKTKFRL